MGLMFSPRFHNKGIFTWKVMLEGKLESPLTFRYLQMLCKCCAVGSTFLTSTVNDK
jgi:hypothetical protein